MANTVNSRKKSRPFGYRYHNTVELSPHHTLGSLPELEELFGVHARVTV